MFSSPPTKDAVPQSRKPASIRQFVKAAVLVGAFVAAIDLLQYSIEGSVGHTQTAPSALATAMPAIPTTPVQQYVWGGGNVTVCPDLETWNRVLDAGARVGQAMRNGAAPNPADERLILSKDPTTYGCSSLADKTAVTVERVEHDSSSREVAVITYDGDKHAIIPMEYVKTEKQGKDDDGKEEIERYIFALSYAATTVNAKLDFEPGGFSGGPYVKMTIPNALPEMAAIAASSICEHMNSRPLNLRVYLIDGKLAAQCPASK
jgi:hypothetical protein